MSQSGDWIGFIPLTIPKCWHYGKTGRAANFFDVKKKGEKKKRRGGKENEKKNAPKSSTCK